ncbi:hypothetical protein GCM10009677_00480 [Sphaerisporangium rubeum]|uniref:DUF4386 domain-containing protein n=1 Tax=Sphaerisporangium rubeum TaxID=321317 RepID=A0A7X0ICR6_9ACTN|nr:DUF4386 family protein [Sphaerisporangium rubeum]MBB6472856.1 hypothetical protein [Sphaerisporangium rubeum]
MTKDDSDTLIRRLIAGDPAGVLDRARSSDEPDLLVAAALADPAARDMLTRAARLAAGTRERQLVAIAAARLAGDRDRVEVLCREHLADHPGDLLVAWIAATPHPGITPQPPGATMTRKTTAILLICAAILTNVAFTALGTVFTYPDVLKDPPGDVLAAFRASQTAVTAWFTVLALSAALFAPIAIGVGRLSRSVPMRLAVPAGVAAAVVQVAGLLRWPLLVPGYAAAAADPSTAAAARASFTTAHFILGTVVGETFGYLLTSAWTLLILVALYRTFAGRWFTVLGSVSALLILTGVLSPVGLPVVDLANFIGYVLWSLWLIAFAVLLLRRAVAVPR